MIERRKLAIGWRPVLLGVAFALHNLEEVLRFQAWNGGSFLRPGVDQAMFANAVIVLSVAVMAVLVVGARKRMLGLWGSCAAVIAGGLLVNALVHLVHALVTMTPVPGVFSGVLVVAPAAIWVLSGFGKTQSADWRARFLALLIGAVVMPMAAFGALRLAKMVGV